MAVDPIKGIIIRPATLSQYSFVVNNPLKYVDLTGLSPSTVARLINGEGVSSSPPAAQEWWKTSAGPNPPGNPIKPAQTASNVTTSGVYASPSNKLNLSGIATRAGSAPGGSTPITTDPIDNNGICYHCMLPNPTYVYYNPLVCTGGTTVNVEVGEILDFSYSLLSGVVMGFVDGVALGTPELLASLVGAGIEPLPNEIAAQVGKVLGNVGSICVGVYVIGVGTGGSVMTAPTIIGAIAGAGIASGGVTITVSGVTQLVENVVVLYYAVDSALVSGASSASKGSGSSNKLPDNARTTSSEDEIFRRLERYHGVDSHEASRRLHEVKRSSGRGPNDNVIFDMTGNVYDPDTREWLGSLTR